MRWIKYIREIVIVFLVVIIVLQRECIRERKAELNPIPVQSVNIERKYIPLPVKILHHFTEAENMVDTVYLPKYITKHDTITIDTNRLLTAYFYKIIYVDTLQDDSVAYIVIKDTISQNRIVSRQSTIHIKPITLYPKPKWNLYAGVGISGWSDKFGLSGKIMYISRSKHAYEISYNPIQKYAEFTIFLKIK